MTPESIHANILIEPIITCRRLRLDKVVCRSAVSALEQILQKARCYPAMT